MPPASPITAPGAVTPSVRSRRYMVAAQMASGSAAPNTSTASACI